MSDDPYLHAVLNQRYRLEESLGGRFGKVYRATGLGGALTPDACIRLFARDDPNLAVMRASYDHIVKHDIPSVLPWLELGRATTGPAAGQTFVVAPYGQSLAHRLSLEALPPSELFPLAETLATALHGLHDEGMVYLKLTPANIVFQQGTWSLADRDTMRRVDDGWLSAYLAQADPYYVPAELWRRELVPQLDMWAFGLLLLEALRGRWPYQGSGLLFDVTMGKLPLPIDLPPPFDLIIRGCLAVEPGRRWSAENVLQVLTGQPVVPDTSWRSPYSLDPSTPVPTPLAGGRRLDGHMSEVRAVAFSPSDDTLVSGALDGSVVVWNLESGRFKRMGGHPSAVRRLRFTPSGAVLVSACREGEVQAWDVASRQSMSTARLPVPISDVEIVSNSAVLLLGDDGSLWQWDWPSQLVLRDKLPQAVAVSQVGPALRWGRLDGQIRQDQKTLYRHNGPVMRMTGTWSIGLNGSVMGPDAAGYSVPTDLWCVTERGGQVAAGGYDRLVYLWASGQSRTLKGHTLGITDLSFSRDGRFLASASKDRKIILWDLQERTDPPQS